MSVVLQALLIEPIAKAALENDVEEVGPNCVPAILSLIQRLSQAGEEDLLMQSLEAAAHALLHPFQACHCH
jgi:hypothetical protein